MADSDIKLYGTLVRDRAQDKVVNGSQVKGGFFTCESIPSWAGETGQLCYCTYDSKFYQYNGSSWAVAQLGGGSKYQHSVLIEKSTTSSYTYNVSASFQFICSDNYPSGLYTISDLRNALYDASFGYQGDFCPASGIVTYFDGSDYYIYIVTGVRQSSNANSLTFRVNALANSDSTTLIIKNYVQLSSIDISLSSYTTFYDTVRKI